MLENTEASGEPIRNQYSITRAKILRFSSIHLFNISSSNIQYILINNALNKATTVFQ